MLKMHNIEPKLLAELVLADKDQPGETLVISDLDGVLRPPGNRSIAKINEGEVDHVDPNIAKPLEALHNPGRCQVALLTSREKEELEGSGILPKIFRFGCSGSFLIRPAEACGNIVNSAKDLYAATEAIALRFQAQIKSERGVDVKLRISPGRFFVDPQMDRPKDLYSFDDVVEDFLTKNSGWHRLELRDAGFMLEDKNLNFNKGDGIEEIFQTLGRKFKQIIYLGDSLNDLPAMRALKKWGGKVFNIAVGRGIKDKDAEDGVVTHRLSNLNSVRSFIAQLHDGGLGGKKGT